MSNSIQDEQSVASSEPQVATGVDRRTLETIFQHPLSHNLAWREVVSLFASIGDVEDQKNGEVILRSGGENLSMTRPHDKDLAADDVMALRHFLTRAGWSPEGRREIAPPSAPPGTLIVIDHAGATLYAVAPAGADQAAGRHLARHLAREAPDRDRDETFPQDVAFFETVARAATAGGRIVLIGHGKGQSNEADHLSAYLLAHHKDIHGRIVGEMVADLPHLSTPELLDLGRHALA